MQLEAAGHDVAWCGDWLADPGDEAVLEATQKEGRVLVTLDKDFGELAIVRGLRHCGIVRLVGFAAREQAAACARVLALRGQELEAGAIATASPGQLRLRLSTAENSGASGQLSVPRNPSGVPALYVEVKQYKRVTLSQLRSAVAQVLDTWARLAIVTSQDLLERLAAAT